MSLWLCVSGLQVQLARGTSPDKLIADLEAAIQHGWPITMRLAHGGRIVLNGGRLRYAAVLDDRRQSIPGTAYDVNSMPSSMITSGIPPDISEPRLDSVSTTEPQTATEPPPP